MLQNCQKLELDVRPTLSLPGNTLVHRQGTDTEKNDVLLYWISVLRKSAAVRDSILFNKTMWLCNLTNSVILFKVASAFVHCQNNIWYFVLFVL